MNFPWTSRRPVFVITMAVCLALPDLARACSTCFGDPDSNIAKGAASGVLVLGAIIYGLMMCFATTTFLWWRRSRRASQDCPDEPQNRDD